MARRAPLRRHGKKAADDGGLGRHGATAAFCGYGAKGHEHKKSFFHVSRDLPIQISVIDSAEKIAAAAEAIEGMLEDGLIVISEAEIVRLVRSRVSDA